MDHQANIIFLARELEWLKKLIQARFALYFEGQLEDQEIEEVFGANGAASNGLMAVLPPPAIPSKTKAIYAQLLTRHKLSAEQRLALILAITPGIKPELLDSFYARNKTWDKSFTEFGGALSETHRGFLPTWETFYFILAGDDLGVRLRAQSIFAHGEDLIFKHNLIEKGSVSRGTPEATAQLLPTNYLFARFVLGLEQGGLNLGYDFPAKKYTVPLSREDLVISNETQEAFDRLIEWINLEQVPDNLQKFVDPGVKVLFFGPPGTGKSLAAALVGQATGRDVYRVDLSKITSKYIGETEKNLSKVFDAGERSNWILFFDEADALFGQRVKAEDHKDRHGNHEVAYLLQRVEEYQGVVILAANLISGIDKAFSRRFQLLVPFQRPRYSERLKIWKTYFAEAELDFREQESEVWEAFAKAHKITAANVKNILRASLVRARVEGTDDLAEAFIKAAIRDELAKEKLI